jgi:hypothetical protein
MQSPREGTKKNHTLVDFGGVNTQSLRQAIGDNEFSWLEDAMPIGHGNLKVVPGPSVALVTLPNGDSSYYAACGNISSVDYMFMFCASGAAYQISLVNYAVTVVATAGTFSASGTRFAQWKNERILIIDPSKGYFDWNGTTLTAYAGTVFSVNILSGGKDFTSSPTVTPTSGAATFTATIGALVGSLSAAGTGYAVGDVLTAAGGSFSAAATITVSAVTTGGVISGLNITTTGDYTTAPSNPVTLNGGHGTGAAGTLNFSITKVVVASPGTGYVNAPSLNVTGGGGTLASLSANLSSSTNGTSIAVYQGRVWIANNRTIVYSAPSTFNDFTTTSLGGSFILTDDTLHSNVYRLFSANNYLYIFGIDSINVISDVRIQTTATSSTTTSSSTVFSNANISPSVGSDMPESIVSNYRTVMFANEYGIYGLNGVSPTKISDPLDGMYQYIDMTQAISAGSAVIFNILCVCFLFKYNDPMLASARQVLGVYFNKKWFFSSQVSTMNFIIPAMSGKIPSMFATDGPKLYKLFSQNTLPKTSIVISKLWDMGSSLITKQAFKLGIESISPAAQAVYSINIDTETNSQNYVTTASNSMFWKNNAGNAITWVNNSSQTINWTAAGYVMSRQDVSNVGNYLGVTINSNSPTVIYSGIHLQYENRTPWAGAPW